MHYPEFRQSLIDLYSKGDPDSVVGITECFDTLDNYRDHPAETVALALFTMSDKYKFSDEDMGHNFHWFYSAPFIRAWKQYGLLKSINKSLKM